MRPFVTEEKAITLSNSFVLSHFYCCPLIWVFCEKKAHSAIRKVYYRTLKIIYNDFYALFDEPLKINKSKSIHNRHLEFLLIEIFRSLNHLNPKLI